MDGAYPARAAALASAPVMACTTGVPFGWGCLHGAGCGRRPGRATGPLRDPPGVRADESRRSGLGALGPAAQLWGTAADPGDRALRGAAKVRDLCSARRPARGHRRGPGLRPAVGAGGSDLGWAGRGYAVPWTFY